MRACLRLILAPSSVTAKPADRPMIVSSASSEYVRLLPGEFETSEATGTNYELGGERGQRKMGSNPFYVTFWGSAVSREEPRRDTLAHLFSE